MTNEERDALIAQGWTPPVAVDPDLAEAEKIRKYWEDGALDEVIDVALAGITRGRELEREATPGMVWKKWDGSAVCPVSPHTQVIIYGDKGSICGFAKSAAWHLVTHYAIITQPEDAA